jgi:hypothetical protein
MKNDFYTYAYLREDGTPFYIGKGKGKRAFCNNGRKWKAPPKERILFLKINLTEEEAYKHEIYMIAIFGRKDLGTGILRNLTSGGEGGGGTTNSKETREKKRKSKLGVKNPNYGKRGEKSHLYGKRRPTEVREKISASRIKTYYLISPEGKKMEVTTTLAKFASERGLIRQSFSKLLSGKWEQYKGWRKWVR